MADLAIYSDTAVQLQWDHSDQAVWRTSKIQSTSKN